jgi:phthalate 4,5-dioxygenase oxygenase subunit
MLKPEDNEVLVRVGDGGGKRASASDLAIVEFRRLMVDAARMVEAGGAAIGTDPNIFHAKIASFQGIISKETDWRTLVHCGAKEAAE